MAMTKPLQVGQRLSDYLEKRAWGRDVKDGVVDRVKDLEGTNDLLFQTNAGQGGRIADLEARNTLLQASVDAHENVVASQKGRIKELETYAHDSANTIDSLSSRIRDLKMRLSGSAVEYPVQPKKPVFLAASQLRALAGAMDAHQPDRHRSLTPMIVGLPLPIGVYDGKWRHGGLGDIATRFELQPEIIGYMDAGPGWRYNFEAQVYRLGDVMVVSDEAMRRLSR